MDSVITFRYFTEDDSNVDKRFSAQYQPKDLDMTAFKQNQVVWQQTLAGVSQPTLYWNNHDMARIATRVAKTQTQAKSLAMLMYLQRGIPVIYYGEELGLKNLHFDNVDQFEDQTVGPWLKDAEKSSAKTRLQPWLATRINCQLVVQCHGMTLRITALPKEHHG